MSEQVVLNKIKFVEALRRVPDGIAKLVQFRSERDEVSEDYAEDRIARRYEFFVDEKERVWVVTDFPEEPGIWVASIQMWLTQDEADDEYIIEDIKNIPE